MSTLAQHAPFHYIPMGPGIQLTVGSATVTNDTTAHRSLWFDSSGTIFCASGAFIVDQGGSACLSKIPESGPTQVTKADVPGIIAARATASTPPPAPPPQSTAKPALHGITTVAEQDHRFGLWRLPYDV